MYAVLFAAVFALAFLAAAEAVSFVRYQMHSERPLWVNVAASAAVAGGTFVSLYFVIMLLIQFL